MTEALTAFDAVALTLIIVSALMALARGFIRELATLGAFIAALAGAYYARIHFRDTVEGWMPQGSPEWVADMVLVVGVFILIYAFVAWWGQRLSKNIQGVDGIGLIDRLAGLVFGVARGGIAVVFFVYLLQLGVEEDRVPEWISGARTYPYFAQAADYVNENAPRIAEDVQDLAADAPNRGD